MGIYLTLNYNCMTQSCVPQLHVGTSTVHICWLVIKYHVLISRFSKCIGQMENILVWRKSMKSWIKSGNNRQSWLTLLAVLVKSTATNFYVVRTFSILLTTSVSTQPYLLIIFVEAHKFMFCISTDEMGFFQ